MNLFIWVYRKNYFIFKSSKYSFPPTFYTVLHHMFLKFFIPELWRSSNVDNGCKATGDTKGDVHGQEVISPVEDQTKNVSQNIQTPGK